MTAALAGRHGVVRVDKDGRGDRARRLAPARPEKPGYGGKGEKRGWVSALPLTPLPPVLRVRAVTPHRRNGGHGRSQRPRGSGKCRGAPSRSPRWHRGRSERRQERRALPRPQSAPSLPIGSPRAPRTRACAGWGRAGGGRAGARRPREERGKGVEESVQGKHANLQGRYFFFFLAPARLNVCPPPLLLLCLGVCQPCLSKVLLQKPSGVGGQERGDQGGQARRAKQWGGGQRAPRPPRQPSFLTPCARPPAPCL